MANVLKGALVASSAAGAVVAAGAGAAFASSHASHSPGAGSANELQLPVHIPVNVVGNTANLVGVLNPAFDNHDANIG